MNEDLLLKLYEKYNLASRGSFDAFKNDMQFEPTAKKFYDKYGLSKSGEFEKFKSDLGIGVNNFSLNPTQRALLDSIADVESGGSYNVIVGNKKTFNNYDDHPRTVGVTTKYGSSTAAGRYQIVASTYDDVSKKLGIKGFDPEKQDKMALYIAESKYKQLTNGRDIYEDLENGEAERVRKVLGGSGASTVWQGLQNDSNFSNRFYNYKNKYQSQGNLSTQQTLQSNTDPRQQKLDQIQEKLNKQYQEQIKAGNPKGNNKYLKKSNWKRDILDDQFKKGILKINEFTDEELNYLYGEDDNVSRLATAGKDQASYLDDQLKDRGLFESVGDWVGKNVPALAKYVGFGDVLDTKNGKININVRRQLSEQWNMLDKLTKNTIDLYLTPQEILDLKYHPMSKDPKNPNDDYNKTLAEIQEIIAADQKSKFKSESNGFYRKLSLGQQRSDILIKGIESKTYKGILDEAQDLGDKVESNQATPEEIDKYKGIVEQLQSTGDLEELQALQNDLANAQNSVKSLQGKYGNIKKLEILKDSRNVQNEAYKKNLQKTGTFLEKATNSISNVFKKTTESVVGMPKDLVQFGGLGVEALTGLDLNAMDSRVRESMYETEDLKSSKEKRSASEDYVKIGDNQVVFEDNKPTKVYDASGFEITNPIQKENLLRKAQIAYDKNPNVLQTNKINFDAVLHGVEETAPQLISMFFAGGLARGIGTATLKGIAKTAPNKVSGIVGAIKSIPANLSNSPRILEAMSLVPVYAGQVMDEGIESGKIGNSGDLFIATSAKLGLEMVAESIFAGPIGKVLSGKGITPQVFKNLSESSVRSLIRNVTTGKISASDIGREVFRIGKELSKDTGTEGLEEAMVEVFEPMLNEYLNYSIDSSFDTELPTVNDVISSFAVGAGAGLLMGGGRSIKDVYDIKEGVSTKYNALINKVTNNSLETKVNGEIVKNPEAFRMHAQTLLDKKIITEEQFNTTTTAVQKAADRSKHLNTPNLFTSKLGKAADAVLGLTDDDKTSAFNTLYRNTAFNSEMLKTHPDLSSTNPLLKKRVENAIDKYENILSDLNVNHANGIMSGITPSSLVYSLKPKKEKTKDAKREITAEDLTLLKTRHETLASALSNSSYSDEVKAQLLELRLKNTLQDVLSGKEGLTDKEKEKIKQEKSNLEDLEDRVVSDENQKVEEEELNERKRQIVNDLAENLNPSSPEAMLIQQERLDQLRSELDTIEDEDDLLKIQQEYTTALERVEIEKYKKSKENRKSGDEARQDKLQPISLDPADFEQSYNNRYGVQPDQLITNQELHDQDKLAIVDAIQNNISEQLPEEIAQQAIPYLESINNPTATLRDIIDPAVIEQLPEELQQPIIQAIEEYFNSKNANVVSAVVSTVDNELKEDYESDISGSTTDIEYSDTIGVSESSSSDPTDSQVESRKDNVMIMGNAFFNKDGYNVEFYDDNDNLINSARIPKNIVESNLIFNAPTILSTYGKEGATNYRLVEDKTVFKKNNKFQKASETILKLNPTDVVYYEVDRTDDFNANKKPNEDNLGIQAVVYLKDGKVTTNTDQGAIRVLVGEIPFGFAQNVRKVAWNLFNQPSTGNIISVGNTLVDKVTTRVDHQFNKRRDVDPSELDPASLFVVEKSFNNSSLNVNDGQKTNSLIYKNKLNSYAFPDRLIPTAWIGSVVMMVDNKLQKLHTKEIGEVPELVEEINEHLTTIEKSKNAGERSDAWTSLLDIVRYRTAASNFDTKVQGQNVEDAKGVGPVINYFPESNKWKLDGVTMSSKEELIDKLSSRRININPALFSDKKYVTRIAKYLQTDLAPSIDNRYRTAPTLYLDSAFNISENVVVKAIPAVVNEIQTTSQTIQTSEFKKFFDKLNSSLKTKIKEIQNNSSFISLKPDGSVYVNKNGKEYQRATSFIRDEEFTGETNELLESSKIIGNKIDILGRDIFNDQLRDYREYDISDDVKVFNKIADRFKSVKASMAARGEYVIPGRIILYNDDLNIAGEVDLMTVDAQGNFRIYDIKTMRGNKLTPNQYGEVGYDSNKVFEKTGKIKKDGTPEYKIVPGKTQDSLRQKHQKQVSVYNILASLTHNAPSITAGIIPFETDYNAGDTKISDARTPSIQKVDLLTLNEITESKKESTLPAIEGGVPSPPSLSVSELESILQQAVASRITDEDLDEPTTIPSKSSEEVAKAEQETRPPNDLPEVKKIGRKKDLLKLSEKNYASNKDDDKGISWFKERLEEVGIEIDDKALNTIYNSFKLGGAKVWGAFHNASVILSSDASNKVTKHEAFHVVFNLFLNDKQREQVLDEAFARFGKELGISKKDYQSAKSLQVIPVQSDANYYESQGPLILLEERIADLFEDYKDELSLFSEKNKTKFPAITKFFDSIYKFLYNSSNILQSYLTDKVTIDGLFYQLENNILGRDFLGRRKASIKELFKRNVDNVLGKNPFTKLTNNWSSQDVLRFSQFINKDLLNQYLLSTYNTESISEVIDNNKNISITDVMRDFRTNIDSIVQDYKDQLGDEGIDFDNDLVDQIISELKTNKDFERIVLVNLLPSRGISIKPSKDNKSLDEPIDDTDYESSENDNEDDPIDNDNEVVDLESWQKNEFSVSPITRMSAKLKEFLSNLPMRNDDGTLTANSDTGQVDYYNFEKIHGKLLQELSDSVDPEEMIAKLNRLKDEYVWAKNIFKNIYGEEIYLQRRQKDELDLTINDLNNLDSFEKGDILSAIWNTIADQTNKDFSFVLDSSGETSLVKSNLRNIINELATKSISYFERNFVKSGELKYDPEKFRIDLTIASVKDIKSLLNDLGFIVDNDTITNLLNNDLNLLQREFNTIYFNLSRYGLLSLNSKGNYNITYTNEEGKRKKTEGSPIQGISVLLYKNNLNSEQRNIFTLGGKTKYNHGVSNYLSRTFSYIKKNVDKFIAERTSYMGSPILMHSSLEWYNDIQNRIDQFDLVYVEGVKKEFEYRGKEYADMFEPDIEALNYNIFQSSYDQKNKLGYFTSTVFSDAGNKAALKQEVFDVQGKNTTIIDKLVNIALVELQRINLVNTNKKIADKKVADFVKNNPDATEQEIQDIRNQLSTGFYNLDNNGNKFQFLTFLNDSDLNLDNISEEILATNNSMQTLSKNAEKIIRDSIDTNMKKNFDDYKSKLQENGLINVDENGNVTKRKNSPISSKVSNNQLKSYYYNQFYYNSVFQIVFSGDLAHYKKAKNENTVIVEAQKRNKQVDSSYSRGLWGIKKTFKTLFLKDIKIPTAESIIDNIVTSLGYSPSDEAIIRDALSSNNITDAATVHTLARRKEIMKAFNLWKPYHNEMFDRLEKGTPNKDDIREILQPIKPFYYGLIPMKENTSNSAHLVPLQLKNSEMVLLPSIAFLHKDGKVRIPNSDKSKPEITDFSEYQYPDLAKTLYTMNRNAVDTVLFESAVKASHFKFLNFDNLNDSTFDNFYSEIPNEYWGIQMEVPSKHEDAKVLIGSQIRKIITADLDPNVIINYQLTEEVKNSILELFNNDETNPNYNQIINILSNTEFSQNSLRDLLDITYELDIQEDLNSTSEFTQNTDSTLEYLRDKAIEKDPSKHVIDAYEIQPDGKTLVPLELAGKANESYLNSLYKKVSKLKQFGAALVNMTSFGFISKNPIEDQLTIKYKYDENGNIAGIDHIQAAIPANSKLFYSFADKFGNIDIEKIRSIDPSILDAIFYRIPTEGKYSIFPIKVTKILPPNSGGLIILPKEATSIAGLDFDVDKMYGFFKKFKVEYKDEIISDITSSTNEALNKNFTKDDYSYLINKIINSDMDMSTLLDYIDPKYLPVVPYLKTKLDAVKSELGSSAFKEIKVVPSSMGSADSRANLRLDIMLGIARSREFARDFHNIGNKEILKELAGQVISTDTNRSYADPRVQEEIAAKNMIGKKLIGIFANSNAFHSLIQGRATLNLNDPISFNGREYFTFTDHNGIDAVGNKISKSLATLLFASTEDAKEPVLAALNINTYTAGLLTTMIRLGIPLEEVLQYSQSPLLQSLVSYANSNNIDNINNILKNNKLLGQVVPREYMSQVSELKNLFKVSDDLLLIERASKVDTGNVGPELSDIITQLNKIQEVHNNADISISGSETILPYWIIDGNGKYKITRNSSIRQLNAFTQILINEVNDLSKYFNYFSNSYNTIRNTVSSYSEDKRISSRITSLVTSEIYNSIIQKVLQSKNIDIYDLINEFPTRFLNDPILKKDKYVDLASALDTIEDQNNVKVLQLTIKPSKLQSEAIRNQIEDLITETQSSSKLGRDLAIYSMLLGLKFSKGGFYHLVPPSFFKNTTEGNEIRSIINSSVSVPFKYYENTDTIAQDILKNNFTKIVKRIQNDDFKINKDGSYTLSNVNDNLKYAYVRIKNASGKNTPVLLQRSQSSGIPIFFPISVGLSGTKIKDYIQDPTKANAIKKKNKERAESQDLNKISITNLVNSTPTTSSDNQAILQGITSQNSKDLDYLDYMEDAKRMIDTITSDDTILNELTIPASLIPPYIKNTELKNYDGSKRLASTAYDAQTNTSTIYLNPVASVDEFFDYIQGKIDSKTSEQKRLVLEKMAEKGWPLERIRELLTTKKLINTFLILHENDHILNKDRDVYWNNDLEKRDLTSPDKIEIETRASVNALSIIQAEKDKNLPDCIKVGTL